jgi:FkbM family methyltransferase
VVVKDVFENDAYCTDLLPRKEVPELVVDVGAHIGCFAALWHRRNPLARIVCIEACPENIAVLRANVGHFAEVIHAACSYEDEPIGLLNAVLPYCESTGGSVVMPRSALSKVNGEASSQYWRDDRELPRITLEEVMQRVGSERIDLLKLDCEGSEYSILGRTPSLDRIQFVLGEYHDEDRWNLFRSQRFSDWDYGHLSADGRKVGNFHLRHPARSTAERA